MRGWFCRYLRPFTHPNNKIHGANMGPTWVLSAPDKPHVGSMNLAIRAAEFVENIPNPEEVIHPVATDCKAPVWPRGFLWGYNRANSLPWGGIVPTLKVFWIVVLTLPARPVEFTRCCLTQWISKLPMNFGIRWVRQRLLNVVSFGISDFWNCRQAQDLYVGPVNLVTQGLVTALSPCKMLGTSVWAFTLSIHISLVGKCCRFHFSFSSKRIFR